MNICIITCMYDDENLKFRLGLQKNPAHFALFCTILHSLPHPLVYYLNSKPVTLTFQVQISYALAKWLHKCGKMRFSFPKPYSSK